MPLLTQLFSDPLGLTRSSPPVPPFHTCLSRLLGHTLGRAEPESPKRLPTSVKRLLERQTCPR